MDTVLNVQTGETEARTLPVNPAQLRKITEENILKAPEKGFVGPTAKELFHGNR